MQTIWLSSEDLPSAQAQLQQADLLGIDCEFVHVSSYFPKPALVQITDGKTVWLVDPLVIPPDFLLPILENPRICKIFHAAHEDILVLSLFTKAKMVNIFDTQIGYGMRGKVQKISYQGMVEDFMGVQLNKEKLLAWLVRPLAENYLHYAMEDVLYLIPCYNKLVQELTQEQFADSHKHSNKLIEQNQPNIWLAIKRQLKKFQNKRFSLEQQDEIALWLAWREWAAVKQNIPRQWVVSNHSFLAFMQLAYEDLLGFLEAVQITNTKNRYFKRNKIAIAQFALFMHKNPEMKSQILSHISKSVKGEL